MDNLKNNILISPPAADSDRGMRLDRFLSGCFPEFSRSRIQQLVKSGCVSADDDLALDNSFRIRPGDSFTLEIPPAVEAVPRPENIPLNIVYEDADILVVDKPAGMTVHPAAGAWDGTLVNALLYHCRDSLSGIGGVLRPGIVHRIDKDTSGLLVVAKNDAAHRGLSAQFAEHSVERAYFAVVYGVPAPLSGRMETLIGRSPFNRKKMAVVERGGKRAVTNYQTLEVFHNAVSLVQCRLETGRTHQIRVHLSSRGNALVGDQLYTKSGKSSVVLPSALKTLVNNFPRQALHAATLGFIHPLSGALLHFESGFPQDMQALISALKSK